MQPGVPMQTILNTIQELDQTHRTWKEKLEVVWEVTQQYKLTSNFGTAGLALL